MMTMRRPNFRGTQAGGAGRGKEEEARRQVTNFPAAGFWRSQFRHRHSTAGGRRGDHPRSERVMPLHGILSTTPLSTCCMCVPPKGVALGGQKATKRGRGTWPCLRIKIWTCATHLLPHQSGLTTAHEWCCLRCFSGKMAGKKRGIYY
jgi:hypothetical protein